ncbi:MAG: hypothetical protein EA377_04940, partial [Phycisphaerales bacterium]
VVVRADRQTNSLIVDAPLQRMSGFEQLVEQLDRQQIMEETEIRTYAIKHADLNNVRNSLQELARAGTLSEAGREHRVAITITAEPMSRRLIVSGPADIFSRVENVIDELDARRTGPESTLRFFRLEHARADTIADMLREVLLSRLTEEITEAGIDVRQLINVTADRKTNLIILSAPRSVMPIAEELIEQLDDSSVSVADPVVRVRPLTFADAREVSQSLQQATRNLISETTNEPMDVRITAAAGSNALILVGLEPDLKAIGELIEPLDARPAMDAIDARTFPLEFADAGTIAPIVQRLLTDQQEMDPRIMIERIRRTRGQVDLTPKIRVETDERTNSLIISAPQQTVALAETLITQLDRPDDAAERTFQTFTPRHSDPSVLAESVRRVIDATRSKGRRAKVELIPEARSGAIVVIGPESETARTLALLEEWDEEAITPPQMDFRIVVLEHAEPRIVAQTVAPLLRDQARWPESLRATLRAGVAVSQPSVTADDAASRVLLSAPQELMPLAMRLIDDLDQARPDEAALDVRIFTLQQANAERVASAVQEAMNARLADAPRRARISINAEPSTNALIVTAASEHLKEVEALVESLDRGLAADQLQVRTVFLKHARADQVAPIVRELLAGEEIPIWIRYDALRQRRELPETGPDVRVSADSRLNAVIISAPPSALNIAEEMVTQLDVDPAEIEGKPARSVRVLTVENADASELATNLTAMFSEDDSTETPPTIRVDATSNSLLIRATDEQFAEIEEIAVSLDRATIATSRQMQMIRIDPDRASAREVAEALRRLLDRSGGSTVEVISIDELRQRQQQRDRSRDTSMRPQQDETAPAHTSRMIRRMAAALTIAAVVIPDDDGVSWAQIFGLSQDDETEADAEDAEADPTEGDAAEQEDEDAEMAAMLEELEALAARDEAAAAPDEPENGEFSKELVDAIASGAEITIAVDEATNSLIVLGSPRAVERLSRLAGEIESQLPPAPSQIRYIALPDSINPADLSRLINQTLAQMTPPGGDRGDYRRRVSVIPDQTAGALIVAASDRDFEAVGELITALSQPAGTEQMVVKVYPLETITAERAASSVRDLITPDSGFQQQRQRGRQAQRMRNLAITLMIEEKEIEAVFDPDRIRVTPDAAANALIVMGPAEAISFVDQFIEMIDQSPQRAQATLRMFALEHAPVNEMRNTLRSLFQARFRAMQQRLGPGAMMPEFSTDPRSNTLIVTASPEAMKEVEDLLRELDRPLGEEVFPLRTVELETAEPQRAAQILEQTVLAADQRRRSETTIVPDNNSGVLLIRASEEINAEIDRVLAEIDRDAVREFEIRTITLERANASAVADAVQRFYDDRARIASAGRGRRDQSRRISIVGDEASRTLLVAASDRDFEKIEELVEQFDSPQATQALTFRVFELQHARATDIRDTVQGLINDLMWNQPGMRMWPPQQRGQQRDRGSLAVRADSRLNALIVTGEGDRFELVEPLIEMLDAPAAAHAERIVRVYRVQHARAQLVSEVLEEAFVPERPWWQPADPSDPRIRYDDQTKTIIVAASAREHREIAELIESIDDEVTPRDHETRVVGVEFARAPELAQTLRTFLNDRARAIDAPSPTATILSSASANALVISADTETFTLIEDLIDRLDTSEVTGDRSIEIIALRDAEARDIARIVREQFSRRSDLPGVTVTPDARTNSLIVNAPKQVMGQVSALIERLDTPSASDETIIRTYALDGARAEEAQRLLAQTLQLDSRGRAEGITIRLEEAELEPVEITARIVADRRSNSLIVTATEASFPVIEYLIRQIDDVPSVSPVDYRIIRLRHAMASDVSFTLRQLVRATERDEPSPRIDYIRAENQLVIAATTEQFKQIDRILEEIDVPADRERKTRFVPLEFAEAQQVQEALSVFYGPTAFDADTPAKRNVRIVADPATNSLVISADETEWEGIESLLSELDSEEYDSSLQLRVLPLTYADASSVARAINEAFQGTIERRPGIDRGRPQRGQRDQQDDPRAVEPPTLLVESQEWVRASAEPLTNSVVVSASRQNIRKIEKIVEQLDVADYAKLPAPRIIPARNGNPEQLAQSLRRLYEPSGGDRRGRDTLRIVADAGSNSVIVRATDEEFQQLSALAEALNQEAGEQGVSVRVLRLDAAPAARVASAIRDAFSEKARQTSQPLSIQVDSAGNALIIASTGGLFREIEETVEQLDALVPGGGQGIFIIELEHISPDEAKNVVETIGLHQPQREDSVARLVSEPIRISTLRGRNAVIVIANPADQDTVVGLLKAVDVAPELAESTVRIVRLKNAEASALAQILGQMLRPADQQADTDLARAVREQVRRLSVRRDGINEDDFRLDLTKPIRIIPDQAMNALIVSSTAPNVRAVEELARMLDQLPVTEAATIQIFPLENISADQFSRIVRDLFTQGKQLGRVPGAPVEGLPAGMVGEALMDEIAMTTDNRTNTVIVAGKENAVALVEVLSKRLDKDIPSGWVEPRLIPLRYADATDLAETLQAVIVEGQANLPEASPLQRQVGRLRMARQKEDGGRVLEADAFQPMTRLVIRPESQLNALVLVGTPNNLEVVHELVKMLDIEAASPSAAVRIYPVEHASAARLAQIVTRLFEEQVRSGAIRDEDRVIVQPDERTNSLIVTTSSRSFAVLESLLGQLDSEIAPDLREIRRIELEHASATRLAGLIQQMMDARLERMRRVMPETAELERATIIAEPRTNSLIIAAGNESFEVIRTLARDLDTSTLGEAALINVIPVSKGNIERIAAAVDQIMERRYADQPAEIRSSQRPLVLTDPRSNSLLVAANAEDLKSIEGLVERLAKTPENPAIGLHVVKLEFGVRAEQIAPRLQRLMQERSQSLGDARTPMDRVTIEPDLASNSLIIAATRENLEVIEGLIAILGRDGEEGVIGSDVEVIMLSTARAQDVVSLLEEMHVREANRRQGDNTVRVTADQRLNAVLVNAPRHDVEIIRGLVDRLDSTKPTRVVETKFIPLQSANALEMVNLIENVLSGRGIGTGSAGSPQSTVLKYIREIARKTDDVDLPRDVEEITTEMLVGTSIRESITLTPDVRTNTVIVSAPRESMRMIEQMIRDLDQSSIGSQTIRIFRLQNADALAMAQILTDLFSLQRQGNLFVLRPREQRQLEEDVERVAGLFDTELTAVPDERQQLSITVDNRTNSLLVSGTPTYLDLVEQVVSELDGQEASERDVFIYQLRNAVAEEVAAVVSNFVDTEQEKLISTLGADQVGSAARLLEREVTIVGDVSSNTVLVSASPRYTSRVKHMIDKLDVDPPQVLIQVMLAEVTLDSADDWGVDLFASGTAGSVDISGGFGLASAFVTGMGVPNLAVASSDFDLLVRALKSQGRLQVLSNPSVMAANNEEASIQVGETIRVPTSTSISDTGRVSSQLEPEEVGVILRVTPSINPDGFVRMVINPEISNVSARTIQISEDFEAPIITRRTADTTVTVFDGQTIVIGGLISDRFERRDRKVPFFGDLPLIGDLFRQHSEETTKTELLIVLTPHVVESPAEVDRIRQLTDDEIDRLSVPKGTKDAIRESRIEGLRQILEADEEIPPLEDPLISDDD